jgi:alkylated DNA repair dioxygenase AlkB
MPTPSLFDPPNSSLSKGYNLLPKEGEVLVYPEFFSKEESDRLFEALSRTIQWQQDKIRLFGKAIDLPRLTAYYGEDNMPYSYSGIKMNPHPFTPELLEIKSKIEKEAQVHFTSVLLNRYRDGKDSMAWHCDNEPELGRNPIIGSVSFGATRTFKFRHLQDRSVEKILLTHGSFLLMQGETQHKWEHAIPKSSRVLSPRINLTFRIIK